MIEMKKKKLLLILVAAAVLYGSFWIYSWYKAQPVAYEFIGRIQKMENGTLFVNGTYQVPGRPDLSGPDTLTDVKITVSSKTEFIKELIYLPSLKELEKTGGMYKPSELRREKTAGAAGDLPELQSSNTGVKFISKRNIYKKNAFKADSLEYIEPIYPD